MKNWNRIMLVIVGLLALLAASGAVAFLQVGVPQRVPVLAYHCIGESNGDGLYVSRETFARQMAFLKSMGYESIFAKDISGELPRNPIVITFDDGYENNYTEALPILQQYGMKATIFVIAGESDRGTSGRLSWEQMREMTASQLVDIQSHTYDLHSIAADGRYAQMPSPGETAEDYRRRVTADMARLREAFERELGYAPTAVAYPNGYYAEALDALYRDNGYAERFTIEPKTASPWRDAGLSPRIPVFSWTKLPLELLRREAAF